MSKIDLIKERLTIQDILNHYNIEVNRGGFIKCFAHSDNKPSMKVYGNNVNCFVCGFNGDLLAIVEHMQQTDTKGAIAYLNEVFNLGFEGELTKEQKMQFLKAKKEREKVRQQKQAMKNFQKEISDKIVQRVRILDSILQDNMPPTNWNDFEMYQESINCGIYINALQGQKRLEFLYMIINELSINEDYYEPYTRQYGCDKVLVLRKIFKKEITI